MAKLFLPLLVGLSVTVFATPSWAELEGDETEAGSSAEFGYVYTAETEEAGETELTLWATDRRGKGEGHYEAQDYRLEVERGITDRFQVALYADVASHHVRDAEPALEDVDRDFAFQGLSAEFIYALRKPTNGRVGFALYAEPGWSRIHKVTGEKATEYELELKAIVQKNFADEGLVWTTNLTLEPEWEHEHEETIPGADDADWEKELNLEVATGLAYRVAPNWWVGGEARYHSVYPQWTHGLHRENYAVYAGPTVHFGAGKFSGTASWQPQLFGAPHAPESNLEYEDHEKRELRLKLSYEF